MPPPGCCRSAVRRPAFALYAFCRLSDDAIDLEGGEAEALARLSKRLDARLCRVAPTTIPPIAPSPISCATITFRASCPTRCSRASGWDCEGRRYATLEDLHAYAARVAGTVGVMMTLLMGVRDPHALARACDLGVAMQLTNIARDVGEDARAGRLYLPLEWLEEAGLDRRRLSRRARSPRPALAE